MLKKLIFLTIALTMVLSTVLVAAPILAVDTSQVCGMDGNNYASADAAEAAGVDVSYEFACVAPTSESGLYEAETDVHFVGALVEVGSTDVPTNIIIRPNEGGLDRTVEITEDTVIARRDDRGGALPGWIPGDQIRVIGKNNENTDVVEATIVVNLSIEFKKHRGINGWITTIDKDAQAITYQWMNVEHIFKYDDTTKFVAAGKNPATVDDLEINDRIRGRLQRVRTDAESSDDVAKIVVVLRRGALLYMKIRTFTPIVTLVRLDSTIIPTTIQVKMENTPGLKANDVNNLIGTEGALITVNVDENTRIVRKYFGRTDLSEFTVGDRLRIVGRVNDDGTVDAKLIKNNSIWKTTTKGHAGVVTEVNTSESYLMVEWTPIKRLTLKKLKAKLQEADNTVTAQVINQQTVEQHITKLKDLKQSLKDRLKTATEEQVGKLKRMIKNKKVQIQRIKHANLKLSDLIERLPAKKIRVDITEDTQIVVGTNTNATIDEIQIGDKVRFRGTKHKTLDIITADTIVVVSSLPEIEEPLDTSLDDVNEVVSEIVTDDTDNAIVEDTSSNTEEEITESDDSETACKAEGETIPVIADPPSCCEGLTLIPPKEADIVGISGICTALCGNGTCNSDTESNYNCSEDCIE